MEIEESYEKLREVLNQNIDNISIIEESIDVKVQSQYFQITRGVKKSLDATEIWENHEMVFDKVLPIKEKRALLCKLASIDKVEAYRFLEAYQAKAPKRLKDWALLAFQESKMLMQYQFMDTPPMYISTGLGGKGKSLRYFIAIFGVVKEEFKFWQRNLMESEFQFMLAKHNSEIEEITFRENLVYFTALIPFQASVQTVISSAIQQCNELGDFLEKSFLVTNVRRLTYEEVIASHQQIEERPIEYSIDEEFLTDEDEED